MMVLPRDAYDKLAALLEKQRTTPGERRTVVVQAPVVPPSEVERFVKQAKR